MRRSQSCTTRNACRPRCGRSARLAAIAVLALFTGVVVANLASGRPKPCPCFGAVAVERPVSPLTLVRNAWLLGLAIIATADPTGDSGALFLPVFLVLALVTLFVVRVTS